MGLRCLRAGRGFKRCRAKYRIDIHRRHCRNRCGETEVDHYNSELKKEYDEMEYLPENEKKKCRNFSPGLASAPNCKKSLLKK